VIGGAGGMGQPKYGGIGGRGGNVILVADEGNSIFRLLNKYYIKICILHRNNLNACAKEKFHTFDQSNVWRK
jgi:GTPase involved in cell partitioning and DNA repair